MAQPISGKYLSRRFWAGLALIGLITLASMLTVYSASQRYQRAADAQRIVDSMMANFLMGTMWTIDLHHTDGAEREAYLRYGKSLLGAARRDLYALCHQYRDITPRTQQIFDAPIDGERKLVKFVQKLNRVIKNYDSPDLDGHVKALTDFGQNHAVTITRMISTEIGRYLEIQSRWLVAISILSALLTVAVLVAVGLGVFRPMRREILDTQRELSAALVRADRANAAKDQFLRHISHQFRTPMNGLSGTAELMRLWSLDEKQRALLEGLKTSVARLNRVCEQALQFAALTKGTADRLVEVFEPEQMLRETTEQAVAAHTKNEIEVSVDWTSDTRPLLVEGERAKLSIVLANLIDNALHHTVSGEVRIHGSANPSPEGVLLAFKVCDDGPGIQESARDEVFESFGKLRSSECQADDPGMGLGLSICREIVLALGGDITIGDASLGGASVSFSLCLAQVAPDGTDQPAPSETTLNDQVAA